MQQIETLFFEYALEIAICLLMLLPGSTVAAPTIYGVSGSFSHKSVVTVSGTQFGNKGRPAPVIWDDAEHGESLDKRWTGWVPSSGDASMYLKYDTNRYGLPMPHINGTHYVTGKHSGIGTYDGGNVELWKNIGFSEGETYYISYYMAVSIEFSEGASDSNYKFFVYNSTPGGPYAGPECWYASNAYPPSMSQYRLLDDAWGSYSVALNPYRNDYSGPIKEYEKKGTWIKAEWLIKLSKNSSGYIQYWQDNLLKMDYSGRTDNYAGTGRSFGIGGYGDTIGNPRRFWDDIYFDNSQARVVLANNVNLNNATVIEPQIPSSWNTGSISISVNLGKFTAGQSAYLFVFDSTGVANSTGFPITVGGSAGGGDPFRDWPEKANLRIQSQ